VFRSSGVTVRASRALAPGHDPVDLFEKFRSGAYPWLLESALPSERLGRFSFAGCDPYLVLRARGTCVELECLREARPGLRRGRVTLEADPFDALRAVLPPPPAPVPSETEEIPFCGGAVAYLGYELADRIENLRLRAIDDIGLPDLYVLCVDRMVSFDSHTGDVRLHGLGFGPDSATAAGRAGAAVDAFARRLSESVSAPPAPAPALPSTSGSAAMEFDAAGHAKAVDAAKQEIAAGNVYQVCLTHRVERDITLDPWSLYRKLRETNPGPFASYLELPEAAIVGSSPERFLRLTQERCVESRPIKGTAPRAADPGEDAANRASLLQSAKDRAENLMIVDLVRNDLGRVCDVGSVAVPELMEVEAYASVFQMVSTVTGRLRGECDAVDLIRAAFPPGSMTGAPKIAAMKIIDRLEPVRRGVYSGALGYFDVRGGLDLCVVIRTALLRGGRAYVQAGGGIVADSECEAEYRESLDKARPLLTLLDRSDPDAAQ
jgi:para-aminobenzoate synthetase component 1